MVQRAVVVDGTETDSKTLSVSHMHSLVKMSEHTTGVLEVWMVEAREFESELKESCVVLGSQEEHNLSFHFKNPAMTCSIEKVNLL